MSAWIETVVVKDVLCGTLVALLVSAWIETLVVKDVLCCTLVALLVSAWIETFSALRRVIG